jgi:regulator of replication initiation timing
MHLSDRIQYLIEEGVNICQIYQHVTNENRKGIIADEGYNIILLQKDQTEKMLADLKKKTFHVCTREAYCSNKSKVSKRR